MSYFLHPANGFSFSSGVLYASEMAAKSQASPNKRARDTNLTGAMVTDIKAICKKKVISF